MMCVGGRAREDGYCGDDCAARALRPESNDGLRFNKRGNMSGNRAGCTARKPSPESKFSIHKDGPPTSGPLRSSPRAQADSLGRIDSDV